jgi:hypothetical protein
VAENSVFKDCFWHPFNLFRLLPPGVQGLSLHSRLSLTLSTSLLLARPPPPHLLRGASFGLHELCCQNGLLSDLPANPGSQYIWDRVPSRSSPSLFVFSRRPLFSSYLFASLSKIWLLLSFHLDPGFKPCHCSPFLSLPVHIGQIPCPARKYLRDGENFDGLAGGRRAINLKCRKSSVVPRMSGRGT